MQAPTDEEEADFFFQSDKDVERRERRKQRTNYDAGDALRLKGKVMALLADGPVVFVATAGFEVVRVDATKKALFGKAFAGHSGPVTSIALLRDDLLLTGSWDKRVGVWNKAASKLDRFLEGHADFVKTVATHAGRVLSGSSDTTIRVWNAETGECLAVLKGHRRGVEQLLVVDDRLYSGASDGSILEWDLNDLKAEPLRSFSFHQTSVYSMVLSEDGGSILSASADRSVRSISLLTGEEEAVFEHPEWVKCVATSAGHLFSGSKDELVRQWSLSSGEVETVFEGHFDEVTALLLHDGTLISGAIDCTLRFWPISKSAKAAAAAAKEPPAKPAIVLSAEEEAELAALMEDD